MRVLLVEDSKSDTQIVRRFLRGASGASEVVTAGTLADALDAAAKRAFDVILLDMTLPDSPQGTDSIRRLHEIQPRAPIVVLSGADDERFATEAVQAGAQDYLVKGQVDEGTLRRSLRYAIERQQLLDRLAQSESALQEENLILRRLTEAAGRVFATLDVRAVVGLLAAEARRLWGGSVVLYAKRANGELVQTESAGERRKPDAFLNEAFASRRPVITADRMRIALGIPGTSGRNEYLLDIAGAAPFGEKDVFALELLRHYIGIAVQNVALFGELQSQRASVIRLNQLKDDLIAVLAHDFKGPLTTIIGFAELVEQGVVEGEDAENALRTIRQAATRLANLANDTLALSRVEQGELNLAADPVNIGEVVRETVEALSTSRPLKIEVRARDPIVRGDPARLRQVFENLIGNAMKYSPETTSVTVRVTETESTVRVAVHDHGIGIPADEMKFLFERFQRASNAKKSAIKGTGLGLYLAKTLVERHGGNIQVQSKLGAGSTFTVVLPRLRDGVGGVLRVLVVTADENLGPYITHELRAQGYAVRTDRTLTAALERIVVEPLEAVMVDRHTINADPSSLLHRASEKGIALVSIGGEGRDDAGWDATLPNPFLTSELRTAMQSVAEGRLRRLV